MPIAATLPTVTATPGDTIVGQKCVLAVLPSGGSQTNYRGKLVGFNRSTERLERKVSAGGGVLTRDRSVIIGKGDQFRITLDEFNANVVSVFMNATQVVGTARIWILDPDDAASTAALGTSEFAANVYLDGDISFQQDQFSEFTLVVDATATITWSRDVSTV